MKKYTGAHNEWDPLEEVIVGTALDAVRPSLGIDQKAIEYSDIEDCNELQHDSFNQKLLEETEEDLTNFVSELVKLNINVKRPTPIAHTKKFGTYDWETTGFYSYCPRDSLMVVGEKIIESPMTLRSRFLEPFAYKNILLDCFREGATWLSAPKPRLLDNTYLTGNSEIKLNNLEPIFDAANVIRAGRDLFYLISNTGNALGAQWLQSILGDEYNINICRNIYNGVHIDSTISFIRPGLVLLNAERINENNIPEKLKKWDKIWCSDIIDTGFSGKRPLSSIWVGMNILMINPALAVVDSRQKKLIKQLNEFKVEVLPLVLRHGRTLGGGFHCVTLDLKRKSKLENYF